jgi:hypothetical protein
MGLAVEAQGLQFAQLPCASVEEHFRGGAVTVESRETGGGLGVDERVAIVLGEEAGDQRLLLLSTPFGPL